MALMWGLSTLLVAAAFQHRLSGATPGPELVYIGCYHHIPFWAFNNILLTSTSKNTNELCATRCSNFGYPYSATLGVWCGCLSGGPPSEEEADEIDCKTPCPGNNTQRCGLHSYPHYRQSIYLNKSFKRSCFISELFGGTKPIATVRALGPKDCQQRCKDSLHEGCFFFSYVHETGKCLLFKDKVWKYERVPTNQTVSSGMYSCDQCFEPGILYDKCLVRALTVRSIFECQKKCQETPRCHYITYRPDVHLCYLKCETSVGSDTVSMQYRRDVSSPPYISGPRSCVGCFDTGEAYVANDPKDEEDILIRSHDSVVSALRCQMLCVKRQLCKHFNFFHETGKCELLKGLKVHSVPNVHVTSGPRACDTCPCERPDWRQYELVLQ